MGNELTNMASNEPLFGLHQPSPPEYRPQLSLWIRQLLAVLLILGGIWVLTLIAPVLPMLTVAFLLSFAMFIPSRSLARYTPLPYAVVVVILYLVVITGLVIGLVVIIPTLANATNSFVNTIEEGYRGFTLGLSEFNSDEAIFDVLGTRVDLSDLVDIVKGMLITTPTPDPAATIPPMTAEPEIAPTVDPSTLTIPPPTTPEMGIITTPTPGTEGAFGTEGETTPSTTPVSIAQGEIGNLINQLLSVFGSLTQTLTSAIGSVTGFFANLLLAVFISFLILLDIPNTQRALASRLPLAYHREFAMLLYRMVRVWNGFFRGQVLIGFMIGLLTWFQLSLMGIGSAVILAVITGVISLIPTIGGIFALLPLSLVPLIQGSSVFPDIPNVILALFVILVNTIINQIIWNVVAPKILGDALQLPLPVIIVGVFIGAAAGGVLGAFLVAPLMATLRVLVSYIWHKISLEDPFPGEDAPFKWGEGSFDYIGFTGLRRRIARATPPMTQKSE